MNRILRPLLAHASLRFLCPTQLSLAQRDTNRGFESASRARTHARPRAATLKSLHLLLELQLDGLKNGLSVTAAPGDFM